MARSREAERRAAHAVQQAGYRYLRDEAEAARMVMCVAVGFRARIVVVLWQETR